MSTESGTPAEISKTSSLPGLELSEVLSQRSLPFFRSASTEEFRELFQVLRENGELKTTYLVLMILATLLATFGLFANSTPVVIGAMILAPLMSPIITLSMATLRQDKKLILKSSMTIMTGMGVAFLFAVILTWMTPITTANSEILARIRPTLLDLGIAVISGVAGAYAHAREEVAKTLAGVAIAVALVPPLAVSAIGLGWLDWSIFLGAALLLLTNLAGMVLAGALTFLVLGFSPFRLASKGVFVSILMVVILSIPLGLGFKQMVDEHRIVQMIDQVAISGIDLSEVRVLSLSPLHIELKATSDQFMSIERVDTIKERLEKRLGEKVTLEVNAAIVR